MGTCMICVAENVTLIKMPCCSYEQCDTCVSKWKKGGNISCPQCRKVLKTASLAPSKKAAASKGAPSKKAAAPEKVNLQAPIRASGKAAESEVDDDVQLALASSLESHEAECKNFETLESQWTQNLEWAISESLSSLSSLSSLCKPIVDADQEAKEMEEALKLSELEQSREDVELRAALEESSTFAAAFLDATRSSPVRPAERLKRKRVEEDDEDVDVESSEYLCKTPTPDFRGPEARYKLIRSGVPKRPSGVKGKQAMRPSMLLSSGDGDSSLPVDVSLRAALELSMKPQRLFRLEREMERSGAGATCCQGDLTKPCGSTCPFQRK